jgi:hypothetical protein
MAYSVDKRKIKKLCHYKTRAVMNLLLLIAMGATESS